MFQFAVLGCGQLGSRHLQSLLKTDLNAAFYVVDPNPNSLETAKHRVSELGGDLASKSVQYFSSVNDLSNIALDFAIIASDSHHRLDILKNLLDVTQVKNILLEKFLFPREKDYSVASALLKSKKTNAWVNCPRRMFENYHVAKKMLRSPIRLEFEANQWGLACNSIHFLDLVAYLSNEKIISVSTTSLVPKVFPSKRPRYSEFFGTLRATFSNGSTATLTCNESSSEDTKFLIFSGDSVFESDEKTGKLYRDGTLIFEKSLPYQSELTHKLLRPILDHHSCDLPTYDESKDIHELLLKAFRQFVEKITGTECDSLPIT